MTPVRFEDYTLLRRIATGGTAEIYLARRYGPHDYVRHLAIKRILPHLAQNPDYIELLLDEARLAAHMHHGNIIEVHTVGIARSGEAYIAMEYLPGVDLGRLLKKARKRPRRLLFVAAEGWRAHLSGALRAGLDVQICEATGAAEALAHGAQGYVDLILCDEAALQIDGGQWWAQLRVEHPELLRTLVLGQAPHFYQRDGLLDLSSQDPQEIIEHTRRCLRPVLPLELSLALVRDLVDALRYVHSSLDFEGRPLAVVHRDINPSNVLVSLEGAVKLVDFGVARARISRRPLREGDLVGTYSYMSPEQASGQAVDARSDLFSVGSVLYELLTGEQPFSGDTDFATLRAVREHQPKPLDHWVPELPEALERIVRQALHKEPSQRYLSAQDLLFELETFLRQGAYDLSPQRLAEYVRGLYSPEERAAFEVVGTGPLDPPAASEPDAQARSPQEAPGEGARDTGAHPHSPARPNPTGPYPGLVTSARLPAAAPSRGLQWGLAAVGAFALIGWLLYLRAAQIL